MARARSAPAKPPAPYRPAWPRCPHCGGPDRPKGPPGFSVLVEVATVSEANKRDRFGKQDRKAAQREAAYEAVAVALGAGGVIPSKGPWFVRLTRRASTRLDKGNLPSALKAVEDQIAACVGVDDGSPLYEPEYEQEPRGKRPEAVLVEVWGS